MLTKQFTKYETISIPYRFADCRGNALPLPSTIEAQMTTPSLQPVASFNVVDVDPQNSSFTLQCTDVIDDGCYLVNIFFIYADGKRKACPTFELQINPSPTIPSSVNPNAL